MTKYRLFIAGSIIEFSSEVAALNHRASNGVGNEVIEAFESTIVADPLASAKAAMTRARAFGADLIDEYGAKNIIRGYTTAQVRQAASQLTELQILLLSGSLYSALAFIEALTPSEVVSQGDIDEFKNKIKLYLGLPL